MIRKLAVVALGVFVLNLFLSSAAFAAIKDEKDARHVQKIKSDIAKIGTGLEAKVEVKLKDGTKLKGFVSEIGNDQFVVTDPKTGTATPVPYPQAQTAKSRRGWIIFGVVIAAIIVIGVVAAATSD